MNSSKFKTLAFVIFASFLFIGFQAFAGMPMGDTDDYEPESNCCFPHGGKCEIWKGEYICGCDDIDLQAQNSLELEPCLEQNAFVYEENGAGCDDESCEDLVCNFEPECCMSMIPYVESEETKYIGGGWGEFCAILANEFCEVCGGENPLDAEITSDEDPFQLYSYIDLRDRDSFVQVTNVSNAPVRVHVQIFDVNNNCNENNFFDNYTGNDTHVYNMSDIQTNDGNPSGVVLPDDAYGMVVVTVVNNVGITLENSVLVGNFRILDNAGYEYRTNSLGIRVIQTSPLEMPNYYFNYNIRGDVTLSDVVGITIEQNQSDGGVNANPPGIFIEFDIDIYNENEVPFSCRDIIFACVDEDNPLVGQLLENAEGASVASFDYGINTAIPHSRGGEVLCPGNNISEGFVILRPELEFPDLDQFIGYVGLNNGNGRGSMDSFWHDNIFNLDFLPQ